MQHGRKEPVMSENEKLQTMEDENRNLKAELKRSLELIEELKQQRDGIYWEYEKIRYSLNEQLTPRAFLKSA